MLGIALNSVMFDHICRRRLESVSYVKVEEYSDVVGSIGQF